MSGARAVAAGTGMRRRSRWPPLLWKWSNKRMGYMVQIVLAAVGVIVAVTLLVAVGQLVAIRKLLEALLRQTQVQAPATRADVSAPQVPAASRPPVVGPAPPPPVQQTRFEEAPEQFVLTEKVAEQIQPAEEVSEQPLPEYRPATVSSPSPDPTPAKPSHMPTIIGIVVLAFAVAFLIFMIVHTK